MGGDVAEVSTARAVDARECRDLTEGRVAVFDDILEVVLLERVGRRSRLGPG